MKAFDYEPKFNTTILKNGVRILTERHPYSRAVSVGVYIGLGSRDEPDHLSGAAHFVEHMVFKGTKTKTAYDIVSCLEAVGGDLNAYTSKEYTCFHASALREHLSLCIEVLGDLMVNPVMDAKEFEKEREVIEQEINMSADNFEEYIFDLYFEKAYSGHKLGLPILGTEKSLNSITRDQLFEFFNQRYHGKNMVIAAVGNIDHDDVVALVEKEFSTVDRPAPNIDPRGVASINSFRLAVKKSSEQEHILLALPSTHFQEAHRFDAYIVNALLGGGMTSRLYQQVREQEALAYSVYSYLHSFTDSGLIMVYAGTSKDNVNKTLEIIVQNLRDLKDGKITKEEVEFFKKQVMGQIILGADDIENRMNSLGVNELIFNAYRPVDHVVKEIEAVTLESIAAYIDLYFDFSKLGLIVLGESGEEPLKYIDTLIG